MATDNDTSRYAARGVSSGKEGVHRAVRNLDPGIFPGAFCKIFPDDRDKYWCSVPHADGAGTKAGLAYLYWKTVLNGSMSDLGVFKGIVQDSIVMNVDDVACVGALGPLTLMSSIDRNPFLIPDEIVAALIEGGEEFCERLRTEGIEANVRVGETADVGDLVRTLTVNHSLFTSMHLHEVIDASNVRPGSVIVGFSSAGMASWEDTPNSGIRSNGLTNARHESLLAEYGAHTETFAPEMPEEARYCGRYRLDDPLPDAPGFTIGSALLSPTRSYAPLIRRILTEIGPKHIQAFFHNSGGGLTKCKRFGPDDLAYVKDNPLRIPPVFRMLKDVRGMPWNEMYRAYNMGVGLEMVTADKGAAFEAIEIAKEAGIDAETIGHVTKRKDLRNPRVTIRTVRDGTFHYR